MKQTPVFLTDEEAKIFLAFRKHQALFQELLNAGVFELKLGTAELFFNADAVLTGVELHRVAFRR